MTENQENPQPRLALAHLPMSEQDLIVALIEAEWGRYDDKLCRQIFAEIESTDIGVYTCSLPDPIPAENCVKEGADLAFLSGRVAWSQLTCGFTVWPHGTAQYADDQ